MEVFFAIFLAVIFLFNVNLLPTVIDASVAFLLSDHSLPTNLFYLFKSK